MIYNQNYLLTLHDNWPLDTEDYMKFALNTLNVILSIKSSVIMCSKLKYSYLHIYVYSKDICCWV